MFPAEHVLPSYSAYLPTSGLPVCTHPSLRVCVCSTRHVHWLFSRAVRSLFPGTVLTTAGLPPSCPSHSQLPPPFCPHSGHCEFVLAPLACKPLIVPSCGSLASMMWGRNPEAGTEGGHPDVCRLPASGSAHSGGSTGWGIVGTSITLSLQDLTGEGSTCVHLV